MARANRHFIPGYISGISPIDVTKRVVVMIAGRTGQEFNIRKKRKGAFEKIR